MRAVILGQCCGTFGSQVFANGILLLFLQEAHCSGATLLLLLNLPAVIQPLLLVPMAHHADRGRLRMTVSGGALAAVGMLLICTSLLWSHLGWFSPLLSAVIGIVLFGVGMTGMGAPWFALLAHLVPPARRGSFFGTLRVSWQLTNLLFGFGSTLLLRQQTMPHPLALILSVTTLGMVLRVFLLRQIPDLGPPPPVHRPALRPALLAILRQPSFTGYCCYLFLVTLATSSAITLFALIERDPGTGFSPSAVVFMGNLLAVGSVLGFWLCGRCVDRYGPRSVFLACHFGYALVFITVLLRGLPALPPYLVMGLVSVGFGIASAGVSVASSTEMLVLAPVENRTLSTGVCVALTSAGGGLAGMLSAGAISLGIFRDHWQLLGVVRTPYDALLLIDAVLVVVLVVALSLVPSVIAPRQHTP